jgi:hypothetical protein
MSCRSTLSEVEHQHDFITKLVNLFNNPNFVLKLNNLSAFVYL